MSISTNLAINRFGADSVEGDPKRDSAPFVSIVVPVYNEEHAIGPYLAAIGPAVEASGLRCEFVFVDDGSRDSTIDVLRAHQKSDPRIRIVRLSRNFGKEAAVTAGLDLARGDVVVPMDVDLQDPPSLLPQLLEKWREGFDVVYGVRVSRTTDTGLKRMTAGWFYRLFNRVSSVPIPENVGDFRLLDRRVIEALKLFPERNRFLKGLFAWVGFRSVGVPYSRAERVSGKTTWNYWKLWNFALDGITGFSTVPLRIWVYFGALVSFLGFAYALYLVVRVFTIGIDAPGYSSIMVAILVFGGLQLLSLGLLGEYVGRIFSEVKQRPIYVVDRLWESAAKDESSAPT